MLSMIGLVSLAGILVNDSIVMVEFIKLRLSEGMIPIEAFSQAGRDRFRAVVLTTATTCMGLMPMLLETSMQATVFKGLVVAIVFGELFSTTMILILIPCSYSVLGQAGLLATNDVNADAVSVTG
ncbi:Nickel and cobalt resistance protein CnrA [Stieleria magnilauensis]|uniref:Nickel and cobalt resistance protein CnrA n=2 Tax=Stieleria TaxID=2795973 RepID=A0ABX5XK22_9BACT|nr:Nickel and cobalt resistance protein CnrA [Planctomycetes bacterium TBK1r]